MKTTLLALSTLICACVTKPVPCVPPPTPAPPQECMEMFVDYMRANPDFKLANKPSESNDGGGVISIQNDKTGEVRLIIILSPYVMPRIQVAATMMMIKSGQCSLNKMNYLIRVYRQTGMSAIK